jgi:hypothetical protein
MWFGMIGINNPTLLATAKSADHFAMNGAPDAKD